MKEQIAKFVEKDIQWIEEGSTSHAAIGQYTLTTALEHNAMCSYYSWRLSKNGKEIESDFDMYLTRDDAKELCVKAYLNDLKSAPKEI